MTDDPFTKPGLVSPPRQPRPGEVLWEFRRADHHTLSCELRFHGESFGWEAQILKDAELLYAHSGFALKAWAIAWAEQERHDLEKGGVR